MNIALPGPGKAAVAAEVRGLLAFTDRICP
jgi:hypothetical protein